MLYLLNSVSMGLLVLSIDVLLSQGWFIFLQTNTTMELNGMESHFKKHM